VTQPQLTAATPVTLTLGLVDAILRYCGQQPHAQVDPLVQAIRAELAPQVQAPKVEQN
jgi:hypothetical protein